MKNGPEKMEPVLFCPKCKEYLKSSIVYEYILQDSSTMFAGSKSLREYCKLKEEEIRSLPAYRLVFCGKCEIGIRMPVKPKT